MTTQDIYFGIQIGLHVLVAGGVVWGICWLGRVLKRGLETQEKAIAAQAEQIKAQSTVLQDFERLNKTMKQVIDTVDAPAMLERWQQYKLLVDALAERQIQELTEKGKQTLEQVQEAHLTLHTSTFRVLGFMLPFLPSELRRALFETLGFPPFMGEPLQRLAAEAPYVPRPGELSFEELLQSETMVELKQALAALQRALAHKEFTESPTPCPPPRRPCSEDQP
jgi:hypothetical protein